MFFLLTLFFVFAVRHWQKSFSVIARFAWRLRWFWISILALYSLLPVNSSETASYSFDVFWVGLQQGLVRSLSLLLVIMYFVLLVHPIALKQLQLAIAWLLRPLRYAGIKPDLISLRFALTLHAVREIQSADVRLQNKINFRELPEQLFEFLQLAIDKSTNSTPAVEQLPEPWCAPAMFQWLVPAAIMVTLSLLLFVQR